jgi:hypothetical protein
MRARNESNVGIRPGTKRRKVLDIMRANSDMRKREVLKLIAEACDYEIDARAYYDWAVKNKHAPGKI